MSKKSNQKPEALNTEKAEAVTGVIETTAQETVEEASGQEQVEATTASEAATASESENPATEDADQAAAAPASKEAGESEPTPLAITVTVVAETPTDLAIRLTKSVSAMLATGAPETVQALHKAEMIVGDLKNALPAAIVAADESLKADLQTLLALL